LQPGFDKSAQRFYGAVMKTQTVSLSLPKELAEFVRQDMSLGAYVTVHEYFRELIRERRRERIESDVKFLEEASAGAPQEEPPPEFFEDVSATQKRLRRPNKRAR
jgi:Arc/MetJ-type ribon-helix-helix transcriptional regulator